jgi:taurine dioxygenase
MSVDLDPPKARAGDDGVAYSTPGGLTVTRLQPCIGALIEGVDLCQPLSKAVADDIHAALLAHGVIFFRDQPIGYENHMALAAIFGEPLTEGRTGEHAEIMTLESAPDKDHLASGNWHSDGTFYEVAPSVSVLHAVKAAPLGGDTCFSSAVAAYQGLPEEVKRRIASLYADASIAQALLRQGVVVDSQYTGPAPELKVVRHPVVRVHPETGEPVLYVNEAHTIGIVGMDKAESDQLMRYLNDQFKRPEYQVRWTWTDHAIAIWDNRAVQHYAVPNARGYRRVERITASGTPSVGLPAAAE